MGPLCFLTRQKLSVIWMRRNRKPWRRPRNAGKGKRQKEQDMSGLPSNQIDHYMTEEELTAEFGKTDGSSFRMPSHADIGSFRPKSKWMNRTSYWRVCQQIRRTYGKGGSSKEPALWKSGICVTDGYQVYHTLEKSGKT